MGCILVTEIADRRISVKRTKVDLSPKSDTLAEAS